jgi:hypothetical protein
MLVGMNQHEVQNVQQISQPESPKFEVDVTDYKTCLESNLIGLNAITYVSGYLLKKCFTKHCCDNCTQEACQQTVNEQCTITLPVQRIQGI